MVSKKRAKKKTAKKKPAKKARGRPRISIDAGMLERLFAKGHSTQSAADVLGISRETLRARIRDYPELAAAKQKGIGAKKEKVLDFAFNAMARGSAAVIIFALKNICGWRDEPVNEKQDGDLGFMLSVGGKPFIVPPGSTSVSDGHLED